MLDIILTIVKFRDSIYPYVYAYKGEFCPFCRIRTQNGYFGGIFR